MPSSTMTYEVRQLTAKEAVEQGDNIWALAFGHSWVRAYAHKELTRTFGAFEAGQLHAVAGVIDYDIRWGGKWVPCGGISAVATVPGQRYQNLITKLLTEAVKEMHERKVPFTSLYPFSYPFYEKMGWAATHWDYQIECETAWLQRASKGGKPKNFRLIPRDRYEEILPLYNRWAEDWNLSLKRENGKFKSMIYWPETKWQLFTHKDGYMIWDMARSVEGRLHVREFAYATEQAYLDGLALLAQMDSQFKTVTWVEADPEPFWKLGMPQPRASVTRTPNMMTRIVHLDVFQKLVPQPLTGVTVADPLGVTAPREGDIGVGEIVQIVTGFWQTPKPNHPAHLHAICADKKAYCIERF